jgi:CDP-glycerol glycerophosphotransferase
MQAKISIVVAIYNIAPYLTACVDSLLKSNMFDCEVLLIDDGSIDGSATICDAYADNNACVTAYHKPNGGLSDARNYGVERAQGEWILFVDGDDSVNIERFNEFLCVLRETDSSVDVIFNDYILNNLRTGKQSESHQITNVSAKTDVLSAKGAIWNVWRYAYRRAFLAKHNLGFKPKWLAEDLDFTTRVFMLPDVKIKFVHIPYYRAE